MLYRVIVGNYTSFAEQTQFDMFPNPKRENFCNHVYNEPGAIPVLKTCALYGANGSGKSNFINALKLIKGFATEFNLDSKPDAIRSLFKANRFKLPVLEESPMSFLIEFGASAGAYIYLFELDSDGVREESLYVSGLGQKENSLIFRREINVIQFNEKIATPEMTEVIGRQLQSNRSLSALSILGRLRLVNNPLINDAFDWLDRKLDIIQVNHQIPWLINQLRREPEVLTFVKKVFSNVGLGIEDVSIKNEPFNEWLKHADDDDKSTVTKFFETAQDVSGGKSFSKMGRQFPVLNVTEEDGVRIVSELVFHQLGRDGYVGPMECSTQSSGTLRLLTLIPALYYAIFDKSTIVIDEIENSIHPVLIKHLIKFFGKARSNGQLIFTTHETALLNQQELLRPDEVWLVEKKEGMSKMYSLNDFKIHKTLSLENGYLDGRFGAIPFLSSIDIIDDEN